MEYGGRDITQRRKGAKAQRRAAAFFLAFVAHLLLLGAGDARAQDTSVYLDKPISRIEIVFEGSNTATEGGQFREIIQQDAIRPGQGLSAVDVRRSIERLVSAGLASRVAVEVFPNGGPGQV